MSGWCRGATGPSERAYRLGCRCAGCVPLGKAYLAKRREREGLKRAEYRANPQEVTEHNASGYRKGCRCAECLRDYRDASNNWESAPPDWSEVAHVMVGHGVRRRSTT